MTRDEPIVDVPPDIPVAAHEPRRDRVGVRRRRSRGKHHHSLTWNARVSRRKVVRTVVVCAGVLVLMALGVYFGLSRQEVSPAESAAPVVVAAADRSG